MFSRTSPDPPDLRWWRSFHDDMLTSLMDRLVSQNLDLQTAAERVLQGRSEREAQASRGLPQLSAKSFYNRDRLSPNGSPLGLVVPRAGAEPEFDVFQNGLDASWELDLFGRVRRSVEAADARTQAAIEDRRAMAIVLQAELAENYLDLRGVQKQLTLARSNLALARHNTALVRNRIAFGATPSLDAAQALEQEEEIAQLPSRLEARQAALINAIGFLLGMEPRALEPELSPIAALPAVPPVVPIGLPLNLVRRRPDIRRAEAQLHAAVAETGVAMAEFYPDVTLAGDFALNSLTPSHAFDFYSRTFQIGPSVSIPLFQGGRLKATLHLRKSQQREAAIVFRRTLLQALREVDDALTDYGQTQVRQQHAMRAEQQAQAALSAARKRYVAGAVDFLNVDAAQARLLTTQTELSKVDTEITTNLVTLYRTLGGGWDAADASG